MTAPLRADAGLRLLRAAVFAAACVTLSAAGHAMASGDTIPLWALLAGWAAVTAVVAPLAGRERSLPGIATAMAAGQLGLHALFSTGQWCAGAAGGQGAGRGEQLMAFAGRLLCNAHLTPMTPGRAEHVIRQAGIDPAAVIGTSSSAGGAMAPGGHAMTGAMGYTLPMLCGHLVAAVIAGWLLRRGEVALWRLVRLSAQGARTLAGTPGWRMVLAAVRVLALVAGVLAERLGAVRARRAAERPVRPRAVALRHSVVRRGPPLSAAAV
ncbi:MULTISPECIES: hypothetical protein [Streptomycetaceae]|uniref:hypothetical protein n=1 Tax=Streptomycetaceae TaxID=2062 RepID=UPI0019294B70|nr:MULTISPECIES: hypothetical protein [Streptomycetaceae]